VPTRITADEWFRGADLVPFELLDEFFLWGTPDDIVEKTLRYVDAGCRHPIWWNVSFLTDLGRTRSSFRLLGEALSELRRKLEVPAA